MAKAYDIPSDDLIAVLSEQLKKDKKIEPPTQPAFSRPVLMLKKFPKTGTGGIQDALLF